MLRYLQTLTLVLSLAILSGCGLNLGFDGWFEGWTFGFGGKHAVKQIETTEVSRLVLTYSEKLRYTKFLDLLDSAIFYEKKINRIRLDFESMQSLDVWEARELLVDVVEEFLDRLNGNAIIYPYLSRTPMTASDLEIYIVFPSFYNAYVDLRAVGMVSLRGGITYFVAQDGLDCDIECWHRRNEFYFQSRNFVKFKRQGEALYKPQAETVEKIYEEEQYTDQSALSNRPIPPPILKKPTPARKTPQKKRSTK
jgi:hypothetical protein